LNFRRAAERLHLSPPALSMQIKKLEGLLDIQLFERDTTKVRLTTTGEVLLPEARALLQQVQELVVATKDAAEGNQGRLRIGFPGRFSHSFIPATVKAFRECYPKVDINLADLNIETEQPKAVEEGRIHVGFVFDTQLRHMSGVDHLLVADVPIWAFMG